MRKREIKREKISQAGQEPAPHVVLQDIMAAHPDALTHAPKAKGRTWEPEVAETDPKARLAGVAQHGRVGAPAQGTFEGETSPVAEEFAPADEQQTGGAGSHHFRPERGEASRQEVGVEEFHNVRHGQKLTREGGFASSVGASEDINCGRLGKRHREQDMVKQSNAKVKKRTVAIRLKSRNGNRKGA
jgi:hypothetical protein